MEAEKSALAILAWSERHVRKLIPVALGGCWSWRGRIGKVISPDGERDDEKGPLPDLQICRGRRVYILYDSNCASKQGVYTARERLVEELGKLKCDVRIIDLPIADGINGPDDYIGFRGDGAVFDLFESATKRNTTLTEGQTKLVDPNNWRELFDGWEEFESAQPISFSIKGFLQKEAITAIAGLSGSGKTWIALALIRALLRGPGKLWNLFEVPCRAERVIYLIPESSRGAIKGRLQSVGLYDEICSERLLIRTLNVGPAPSLSDPRLLRMAEKAQAIILDTGIRFMKVSDESSASEIAEGLSNDMLYSALEPRA